MHTFKKHGFAYVLGALFGVSLILHFVFAYYSEVSSEQKDGDLLYTFPRDVFENWQSEMLQLFLQVVLLAYLWYVGSPQSREGQDRLEEKLDWLMHQVNPIDAARLNQELEKKFPKK